jgi:hypothetical protein
MVKFMIDALNQRQCDPIKIKCQPCDEERLGFYVPEQKVIMNRLTMEGNYSLFKSYYIKDPNARYHDP